jgi:hypothetical protein
MSAGTSYAPPLIRPDIAREKQPFFVGTKLFLAVLMTALIAAVPVSSWDFQPFQISFLLCVGRCLWLLCTILWLKVRLRDGRMRCNAIPDALT